MMTITALALSTVLLASTGHQVTSRSGGLLDDLSLSPAQKLSRLSPLIQNAASCIVKAAMGDPRVQALEPESEELIDLVIDVMPSCRTECYMLVST